MLSLPMVFHAGMVDVGHRESHHHLHGSRRGDRATHRRPNAAVEVERVLKRKVYGSVCSAKSHANDYGRFCTSSSSSVMSLCLRLWLNSTAPISHCGSVA